MIENQFKLQFITKIKANKNSLLLKKFPIFLGANSNLKKIKTGNFFLKRKKNFFKLEKNFHTQNINKIYHKKNYIHNTPPPNQIGWGNYLSSKQFLNIKKYLKNGLKILEIGAGSIFFAKRIIEKYPSTSYTILDPSVKKTSFKKKLKIINKTFPEKKLPKNEYDLIIIFNCLEHIFDVSKSIKSLNRSLSPEGNILLEVPEVSQQLQRADFNMFTFEHYNYFDLNSLNLIFQKKNLYMTNYKIYNDTIFCVFAKKKNKNIVKKNYTKKFDLRKYREKFLKLEKTFNNLLKKKINFGIHGANLGTYNILHLLNLHNKNIKIFDSDKNKVGKFFGSKVIKIKKAYSSEYKKLEVLFISALSFIKEIKKEIKFNKIKFKKIYTL